MHASSFEIHYLQLPGKGTRILYIAVLIFLLTGIGLLPFLYVDVGIKAPGILQGVPEKIDMVAPSTGILAYVHLAENQDVQRGQLLIQIDTRLHQTQNETQVQQQQEARQYLHDLTALIHTVPDSGFRMSVVPKLSSTLYRFIWNACSQTLQQQAALLLREKQHYDRQQSLYSKNVISREEFEQHHFRYEKARLDEKALISSFKSQWQQDRVRYQTFLSQLREKTGELAAREQFAVLKAPVQGTLQHISGLYPGSFISAQQKIGELVPESSVIAYCYLNPEKIGYVRKGQRVRLHIDTFNAHSWGTINARTGAIPANVTFKDDIPFFKIPCIPDKDYLQLKNGYKGFLRKGMTCRAHFILARRTLFQLLCDRMEDWLKP